MWVSLSPALSLSLFPSLSHPPLFKCEISELDRPEGEESGKETGVQRLSHTPSKRTEPLYCATYTLIHPHWCSDWATHNISQAWKMLFWQLCLVLLLCGFHVRAIPSTNIKITQGELCHVRKSRPELLTGCQIYCKELVFTLNSE